MREEDGVAQDTMSRLASSVVTTDRYLYPNCATSSMPASVFNFVPAPQSTTPLRD